MFIIISSPPDIPRVWSVFSVINTTRSPIDVSLFLPSPHPRPMYHNLVASPKI